MFVLPTFEKSANYYNRSLRGDLISNISYEARLLGLPALKPEKSLDTKTFNIDFIAKFRGISVDEGDMNVSLSSNYTISNKRK